MEPCHRYDVPLCDASTFSTCSRMASSGVELLTARLAERAIMMLHAHIVADRAAHVHGIVLCPKPRLRFITACLCHKQVHQPTRRELLKAFKAEASTQLPLPACSCSWTPRGCGSKQVHAPVDQQASLEHHAHALAPETADSVQSGSSSILLTKPSPDSVLSPMISIRNEDVGADLMHLNLGAKVFSVQEAAPLVASSRLQAL